MVGGQLRILVLEDVPTDAELMENELREAGMDVVSMRVDTRTSFVRELKRFAPDIILSDFSLPSFDGVAALRIALKKCPDVPFIFVSGALGEELAIELLKKGATDYVLKHRLSRLAPAVSRALLEVRERNERQHIEDALRESELRYRTIFDNTGTATIIVEEDATIMIANREFEKLSGFAREDLEGKKNWMQFIVGNNGKCPDRLHKAWPADPQGGQELQFVNRRGEIRHVLTVAAAIPETGRAVVSLLDVTERKKAEYALKKREQELELKSRSLEEANTALKVLLKHREDDKAALEETVLSNVRKLVQPYLEKLKLLKLNENQAAYVQIIESHLNDIISPFLRNLTSRYMNLTPREIEVASLVREGKTTKEIVKLLNISATAVDFHRKNIRAKFGIKNTKSNLRSYLLSLSQ
ncbi:MAG: PAS domain S-box protein [Syntrophales bacterium]